ncbi:MAG: hypothetical protein LWX56_03200 [Ignavibacteria bacterium]|nr:hypothetical protein [Ignavibacteria bacterium]
MKIQQLFQSYRLLFISIIVLLVLNFVFFLLIGISKAKMPKEPKLLNSEISLAQTEIVVKKILNSFGLADSVIHVQPARAAKKAGVSKLYQIGIPSDLPVPFIIYELQKTLSPMHVILHADEQRGSGNSTVKLIVSSEESIQCEFQYRKSWQRYGGEVIVIITGADKAGDPEWKILMNDSQPVLFSVPANSAGKKFAQKLSANKKQYCVQLSDDIDELDFRLQERFTPSRIKTSISNTIAAFPGMSFCYAAADSRILQSGLKKQIEKVLGEKDFKLLSEKNMVLFPGYEDDALAREFIQRITGKQKGPAFLVLPYTAYEQMEEVFADFRKRGGRFVRF